MSYLCGVSRQQMMLLPESVEDYVGPENPVRVIDAFVDGLDLGGLGFEVKAEQAAGAPPYDPKALLKLYIYGYLNRIRSSRNLEKATRRNLEVIWLLGRLTPDHWTINAFRRTNRKHFKEVFRQFNLVCGSLGLFGAELVAYVPAPRTAAAGEGQYPIESFRYDAPRDLYICPQGRELTRHSDTVKSSGRYHVYYDSGACGDCPVRKRCTRGAYRKLAVHEHQEFVDAARTRLRERPQVMAQRRALAEHPFGTMKFWLGYRAFLNRGLEMVRAEFSLTCLAYNLRRTLNLLGVRQLLATLRAKTPISAPLAA